MLSTLRLPAKSFRLTSFRSLLVSVKSGAVAPFCGSVPATVNGIAFERDGSHVDLL